MAAASNASAGSCGMKGWKSDLPTPSFRDAPRGAGPESITPVRGYGFGLALCAPRNDESRVGTARSRRRLLGGFVGRQQMQQRALDRGLAGRGADLRA